MPLSGSASRARPHVLFPPAFPILLTLVLLALSCLLGLAARPAAAVADTWSARAADLGGAAELAKGGQGITVAVLDTWVASEHKDFRGHVLDGATCQGGSCRPGSNVPDACEPHGTHVAGLIGSSQFGVAPEAKLLPVRVLTGNNGACNAQADDVALGVRWAAAHGAQVINISIGSTYALPDAGQTIPRAVSDVSRQGVVVVVAAGNGKTPGAAVYGDDALVVAATRPNGQLADYSERGPGVDLAAPGGQATSNDCTPSDCVVSTWSDNGYAADVGTSMASPYVAGAAALLLAQDPNRGRSDVISTLLRTAHPLAGAGAGSLDVLAAVRVRAGATGPASALNPSAAQPLTGQISTQPTPSAASDRQRDGARSVLTSTATILVVAVAVALVLVLRSRGLFGAQGRFDDRRR